MKKQTAFSLLETLISVSLFSISGLAMANSYSYQLAYNTQSELRSGAILAAQEVLDLYRIQDPSTLPSSGNTTSDITIGQRVFNTTTYFCENSSYCSTASIKQIRVRVSFQQKDYYNVETIYVQLR